MESSESLAPDLATPGQKLREAREQAGISPREMADRLNWLPVHVNAIEEDRYESLRSAAFVRGYLRAYARALSLDADQLVQRFDELIAGSSGEETEVVLPTSPASNQKTGFSVILGVGIAVLVIGIIWWQSAERLASVATAPVSAQTAESATAPKNTPAPTVEGNAEPASAAATSSDRIVDGAGAAAMEAAPEEAPETASEVLPEEIPEAAPEAVAAAESATSAVAPDAGQQGLASAEPGAQSAAAAEQALASSDQISDDASAPAQEPGGSAPALVDSADGALASLLTFEFSDDCWLEVRDAGGQLIYANLERAGDTVRLDGEAPFEVLAGNAAAVSVSFRGEPFAFRIRPGRDTARFTVGEP